MSNRFDKWLKERDELLKNLETKTLGDIIKYCNNWKIPMPSKLFENEEQVKGSLHKARLGLTKLTDTTDEELKELQDKSRKALDKLGWDYNIF